MGDVFFLLIGLIIMDGNMEMKNAQGTARRCMVRWHPRPGDPNFANSRVDIV